MSSSFWLRFRHAVISFVLVAIGAVALPGPLSAASLPLADRILVLKGLRQLELLHAGAVIKSYPIALGRHPVGPKRRLNDGRTPEGVYVIDARTIRTRFHRALHISYPSNTDRGRAEKAHVNPGAGIFIHGMPARFGQTDPIRFFRDWTDGCISVGNIAIEEIWDAVANGTPIEIRP